LRTPGRLRHENRTIFKRRKNCPDYRLEGEYADCYAPTSDSIDHVRRESSDKVKSRQADRLILNLSRSNFTAEDIKNILIRKPIKDLKELKVITKSSEIVEIFPFSSH